MALKRKMLEAMGIESEKIDQIIEAHAETLNAIKEERDKYKEDAEKLVTVQKELNELKDSSKGNEALQLKYNALKEEFDTYKKDTENKETRAKKTDAFIGILKNIGVSEKRIASVAKISADTIDKIELDKEGNIKGINELTETLKTEWADFIGHTSTQGAAVSNPPISTGASFKPKSEIIKIKDPIERQRAWQDYLKNNGKE